MRNLQEQIVLVIPKILQILGLSASNCKSFSQSVEQFFLTVGQNNFGNKIPFFIVTKNYNYFILLQICNHPQLLEVPSSNPLEDSGHTTTQPVPEKDSSLSFCRVIDGLRIPYMVSKV